MKPGNGIDKAGSATGGSYTNSSLPNTKDEATGKFAGAGKTRDVAAHPTTSLLTDSSTEASERKSINDWTIETTEATTYLQGKLNALRSPTFSDKKLAAEAKDIHAQIKRIHSNYNRHIQHIYGQGLQKEAITAAELLSPAKPQIAAVKTIVEGLQKVHTKNKVQLRQQLDERLVQIQALLQGVKVFLESEHVIAPSVETVSPESAKSSSKSVQADLTKLDKDMKGMRVPELMYAYRKAFLNGPMSRLKQPLHTFYSSELERFRKLKPLLDYSNAWYSRLHKAGVTKEEDKDAAGCYAALKFLEEQCTLLEPRNIDKELNREAVLASLKKADKHILHLHRFDRSHSESLNRMLATLPPAKFGKKSHYHLLQLLSRWKLPAEGSKYTSVVGLDHQLAPLSGVLTKTLRRATD